MNDELEYKHGMTSRKMVTPSNLAFLVLVIIILFFSFIQHKCLLFVVVSFQFFTFMLLYCYNFLHDRNLIGLKLL